MAAATASAVLERSCAANIFGIKLEGLFLKAIWPRDIGEFMRIATELCCDTPCHPAVSGPPAAGLGRVRVSLSLL